MESVENPIGSRSAESRSATSSGDPTIA